MNHFSYDGITNSILHDSLNYQANDYFQTKNINSNSSNHCIVFGSDEGKITFGYSKNTNNNLYIRIRLEMLNKYSYCNVSIGDKIFSTFSSEKLNNKIDYLNNKVYNYILLKNSSGIKLFLFNETSNTYESIDYSGDLPSSFLISVYGKYVNVYDVFVDSEHAYTEDSVINICKNRVQIFKNSDGSVELNSYNLRDSQNSDKILIDSDYADFPYIGLLETNAIGKLDIVSRAKQVNIPNYRNDVDLSIKQYLSKSKIISYYLCKYGSTSAFIVPSCLEYNSENSICYIDKYIGSSFKLKVPYFDYSDYEVYVNGARETMNSPTVLIDVNTYSQKTIKVKKKTDTNFIEFTIYNIEPEKEEETVKTLQVTFNDFTSCGYVDYFMAKGTTDNSVTALVNGMQKSKVTHIYTETADSSLNNIAPKFFKVPATLGSVTNSEGLLERGILLQDTVGILVNKINNFLDRE